MQMAFCINRFQTCDSDEKKDIKIYEEKTKDFKDKFHTFWL